MLQQLYRLFDPELIPRARPCAQLVHAHIVGLVDFTQLTPAQLQRTREAVERRLVYITRVVERMQSLGFPSNDRLYSAAVRSCNAMTELSRAAMRGASRHGAVKSGDPYRVPIPTEHEIWGCNLS